jgi:hypothetical protein
MFQKPNSFTILTVKDYIECKKGMKGQSKGGEIAHYC